MADVIKNRSFMTGEEQLLDCVQISTCIRHRGKALNQHIFKAGQVRLCEDSLDLLRRSD